MIRKGRFAVWNNREFELVSYRREYYLRSENPRDLQLGFSSTDGDQQVFTRPISLEELEDAYEIIPYAMILSYRFAIVSYNQETGRFALVTNNPFVKNKVAVRPYGKLEYIIEVCKEDIIIQEDRVPILGFDSSFR